MRKSQPSILICFIVALVLLSACGQRQQAPLPRAQKVAVITLQPQGLELTTELPGRTSAYLVSEFRPQVNGIIQKRLLAEGTDVKAAQVLQLGIVVGTNSDSSAFFNEYQCRSDCTLRYSIKRDIAGHVMLPFDVGSGMKSALRTVNKSRSIPKKNPSSRLYPFQVHQRSVFGFK